jgi:hypothetical protein
LHLGEEAERYGEALQVSVLHALVLQAALPGVRWQAPRPHGAEQRRCRPGEAQRREWGVAVVRLWL